MIHRFLCAWNRLNKHNMIHCNVLAIECGVDFISML